MDNAKMINALTAAVLANASDDQIRDEALLRKTVLPVRLDALLALLDGSDTGEYDYIACTEAAARLPLTVLLDQLTARGAGTCANLSDDALLEELKNRGQLHVALMPNDTLMREVESRLQEERIPDADGWLWHHIVDKDGCGEKWVAENSSEALYLVDESDKEDFAREWIGNNMSEAVGEMDMDSLVAELTRAQKRNLLVALAGEADF